MNILILTDTYPPDYLSGVAEVAKNLNDSFTASGHSVYVLTTGKKREEEQGGIYRSSKSLIWGVFINNFIVFGILRKHKIDAIHLHQSSSNFFLIFRIFGFIVKFPKIITTLHVTYFSEFAQVRPVTIEGHTFKPTIIEYVQKYFFAPIHMIHDLIGYVFADEVTTLSTEGKKEILETYGKLLKKDIHIVPNGINLNSNTSIEFKKDLDLEKKLENKTVSFIPELFESGKECLI